MRTLKGVDIEIDEDRMELYIRKGGGRYDTKRHYQLVKLDERTASAVIKAMLLMEPKHA